jgi:type II pantothenate kinase
MQIGIDFGLTNTDVVAMEGDAVVQSAMLPSTRPTTPAHLAQAIAALGRSAGDFERLCVTGGQHRQLPDEMAGVPIAKADEIASIGLGGLYLARRVQPDLAEALIVSAGSGTAIVAARGRHIYHVTGSAVGGGTLLGLCRLLIGTADPAEVNRLALAGNPNKVDITLIEAVGGAIGRLPADTNAVNFGKAARREWAGAVREDLAAAAAVLVGQVIAVIAINAARAEQLQLIVMVGHLMDLPCVQRVVETVAGYYGAQVMIPPTPGLATAIGAVMASLA